MNDVDTPSEPTCGKGLAENSWLPAKLSKLANAMAELLQNHITALDTKDANSRKEYDAYSSLVTEYREIAARLDETAEHMAGYRDLPMAEHDPKAMADTKNLQAFENLIACKQELLDLLQKTVEDDRKMLAEMGASRH
jgi:hypothetical protein